MRCEYSLRVRRREKHLVDNYLACGKNEVLSFSLTKDIRLLKANNKGEKHGDISLVD